MFYLGLSTYVVGAASKVTLGSVGACYRNHGLFCVIIINLRS